MKQCLTIWEQLGCCLCFPELTSSRMLLPCRCQLKQTLFLRCLWKRRSSVTAPVVSRASRHLLYPPPPIDATTHRPSTKKRPKSTPQEMCHPHWHATPNWWILCHPHWHATPIVHGDGDSVTSQEELDRCTERVTSKTLGAKSLAMSSDFVLLSCVAKKFDGNEIRPDANAKTSLPVVWICKEPVCSSADTDQPQGIDQMRPKAVTQVHVLPLSLHWLHLARGFQHGIPASWQTAQLQHRMGGEGLTEQTAAPAHPGC